MPIKYLCIDDEADSVVRLTQNLEDSVDNLEFEVRQPKAFDEQIREIIQLAPSGLLLDLRLDKTPSEDGTRVMYRAFALAQELRTRMTENEMVSFPIVLWSVDAFFKESYMRDRTSHDLFDFHFSKRFEDPETRGIASKLASLSKGYDDITAIKSRSRSPNLYSKMIALTEEFDVLDARVSFDLSSDRLYPIHMFADSILRGLVLESGVLINEALLACRLGVDLKRSDDWERLREKLSENASYTGVFGDVWKRWWTFKVIREWNRISPDAPLQRLSSSQRIEILKKKYRLKDLVPVEPVQEGYRDNFWNICFLTGRAISPTDSVKLNIEHSDWQDGVFASLKAILDREHKTVGVEIHSHERSRVMSIVEAMPDE